MMEDTMKPTGMHEFVLEVAEIARSEAFYTEVLGLDVVDRWTGERPAVWFDCGDRVALGIWTRETGGAAAIHNGRGGAHVHFALRVPPDSLDAWETRLKALGQPVTRVQFDDGNASVYIDDPDGHCVELMAAIVDWAKHPL
jgi:catechol 2,3-dioxygenase-like lactoylglutathione lyase family enzyme